MIELKGKYNKAKIFTDVVDETSISEIILDVHVTLNWLRYIWSFCGSN